MDEIEQMVRQVCAEALGRDDVGPTDDLVDAGLDSSLTIEVITRLQMQYGVDVLDEFFVEPTVAHLARAIQERSLPSTEG
ncbi:acyl carrier protein [Plantactinospora sp. S1510]|uniref:Acyl carrier protein n=1 Tax=Plantactinospora alkalitolerans TaxID=2789879 RepID=A0ABS0GSQ6_9ACTN|nr:acyl carrier protein [Plantactinospora alkalitolerans]MBF9129220.1 acyl carrier protein [Plantactinospora alkalitolerans]